MDRGDLFDRLAPEGAASPASDSLRSARTPAHDFAGSRVQRDIDTALKEAEELARMGSAARTRSVGPDLRSPQLATILEASEQLRQQVNQKWGSWGSERSCLISCV